MIDEKNDEKWWKMMKNDEKLMKNYKYAKYDLKG